MIRWRVQFVSSATGDRKQLDLEGRARKCARHEGVEPRAGRRPSRVMNNASGPEEARYTDPRSRRVRRSGINSWLYWCDSRKRPRSAACALECAASEPVNTIARNDKQGHWVRGQTACSAGVPAMMGTRIRCTTPPRRQAVLGRSRCAPPAALFNHEPESVCISWTPARTRRCRTRRSPARGEA